LYIVFFLEALVLEKLFCGPDDVFVDGSDLVTGRERSVTGDPDHPRETNLLGKKSRIF
jgi:hypothetical protein